MYEVVCQYYVEVYILIVTFGQPLERTKTASSKASSPNYKLLQNQLMLLMPHNECYIHVAINYRLETTNKANTPKKLHKYNIRGQNNLDSGLVGQILLSKTRGRQLASCSIQSLAGVSRHPTKQGYGYVVFTYFADIPDHHNGATQTYNKIIVGFLFFFTSLYTQEHQNLQLYFVELQA